MNRAIKTLLLTVCAVLTAQAGEPDAADAHSIHVDLAAVVAAGEVKSVDGVTSAGQPDADALQVFADNGYAAVIDLRGLDEKRGYDEAGQVKSLGMDYVQLPVVGRDGISFDNAAQLDSLLEQYDAPVLVHCGSGNRVGALLALRASLAGADDAAALELGRSAGLTRLESIVKERLDEQ